jgi:hypothetical protein
VQSGGLGLEARAHFQQIGDVFAAIGLEGAGVLEGASGGIQSVDLAQGHDFVHVVSGVEAAQLELRVVSFGLRGKGQEALQ